MILLGNKSSLVSHRSRARCKYFMNFSSFIPKTIFTVIAPPRSISDIRLETHLGKDSTSSNNSNYGSRGALAWTPPASMEGSTPTWTEGTPSFTESSSSENEIGEKLFSNYILKAHKDLKKGLLKAFQSKYKKALKALY
jgi:hypothetical protein